MPEIYVEHVRCPPEECGPHHRWRDVPEVTDFELVECVRCGEIGIVFRW